MQGGKKSHKVTFLIRKGKTFLCDVMKQNESEVGSDMLLVSDYFYTSNICQ